MIEYNPKDQTHELLIEAWFHSLRGSDDLAKAFFPTLHTAAAFLNYFAHSANLLFEVDSQGLCVAGWIDPFMNGAYFGLWVREDHRKSRQTLTVINQMYEVALDRFQVLIGISAFPEHYAGHLRMGYKYIGEIDGLIQKGKPAKIYAMDKVSRANVTCLDAATVKAITIEKEVNILN